MSKRFGFILEWETCNVYTRLMRYLQYVLSELQIPFVQFGTLAQCEQRSESNIPLLVFIGFDSLCQRFVNKKQSLPSFTNVQYIHVISEPNVNLVKTEPFYTANLDWMYAVLNFNMNQLELTRKIFPRSLQFTCFQGYTPREDFISFVPFDERTIDVLAAGFSDHSEDRRQIVKDLRARGLMVQDKTMYGDEFDRHVRMSKVAICYPHDKQYNMWYGQRTLWPLNKQTCVVTIPSDDTLSEEFYADLFINTTREKFVDTVVQVIHSGEWKQFGRDAHVWFKHAYHGPNVFDERLYLFCRDWTT